jgi:hypothetical protein
VFGEEAEVEPIMGLSYSKAIRVLAIREHTEITSERVKALPESDRKYLQEALSLIFFGGTSFVASHVPRSALSFLPCIEM